MRNARRFLAFNTIGTITAVDQDSHTTVLFESFDVSARRNYTLREARKFCMASLAPQGALYASVAEPADGVASSVFYKPFEQMWGSGTAEWSFDLPQGESVVALAMGGPDRKMDEEPSASDAAATVALVATSRGFVRVFSSAGLQRLVWHLGSDVVTMVAGAHTALIVTRTGAMALAGRQGLEYMLLDLQTLATVGQGKIPLAKDATLVWAGFNEYDTPVIYGSQGLASVLDGARSAAGVNAKWLPVLDTTQLLVGGEQPVPENKIHYWPVGALVNKMLFVMLKGSLPFPDASVSRPLIQELELALPVLDSTSTMGKHEETWLRQSLLASMIRSRPPALVESELDPAGVDQNADKALLQLIQLACKSDKMKKAVDGARELRSGRTLDAAVKIAQYFGLASIVDRMQGLRDYVETRSERADQIGQGAGSTTVVIAASPAGSNVLVPESQEARRAAHQALTEDFAPLRKPKAFRLSAAAASGSSASFLTPSSAAPSMTAGSQMSVAEEIQQEENRLAAEADRRAAVDTERSISKRKASSMEDSIDSARSTNTHGEYKVLSGD